MRDEEKGFQEPVCWALSLAIGLAAGAGLACVAPEAAVLPSGGPDVPALLALPFGLLLLAIAVLPFLSPRFWERHFGDVAFLLGAFVGGYYLRGYVGYMTGAGRYGPARMKHVFLEYFQFIALIGSLYVVSGGILIHLRGRATPLVNTAWLAAGAVLANVFGTTGAAVLFIRPFLRANKDRIRPFHVILFIFIVANTGGCLTPIGDPPLFLGYLQGVPFTWTLQHCFLPWLTCGGLFLAVFFALDTHAYAEHRAAHTDAKEEHVHVTVSGWLNFAFLFVVLFGVFLDGILAKLLGAEVRFPAGACLQLLAAWAAHKCSKPENLRGNGFSFQPIREVALLFAGLFATMVPALDYLQNHATALGVTTPSAFYWLSGTLSSVLDNAPTYLNYLSAAHGLAGMEMGPATTPGWMALNQVAGHAPGEFLLAISLGSVFFGACTYIGNGPNFMVKAIGEAAGVPMPGFFGYILRYTLPIALPVFFVVWFLFIRA